MHLHPPYLDILVGSSETEGTDCLGSASGPPAQNYEAGIVEVPEEGRGCRRCRRKGGVGGGAGARWRKRTNLGEASVIPVITILKLNAISLIS